MSPRNLFGQKRRSCLRHLARGQRASREGNDQLKALAKKIGLKNCVIYVHHILLPLFQQILGGKVVQWTVLVNHMANCSGENQEHTATVFQLQQMLEMSQLLAFRRAVPSKIFIISNIISKYKFILTTSPQTNRLESAIQLRDCSACRKRETPDTAWNFVGTRPPYG